MFTLHYWLHFWMNFLFQQIDFAKSLFLVEHQVVVIRILFSHFEQHRYYSLKTDFLKTVWSHLTLDPCVNYYNSWFYSRHIVKVDQEIFHICHSKLKWLQKDWMVLNGSFTHLVLCLWWHFQALLFWMF